MTNIASAPDKLLTACVICGGEDAQIIHRVAEAPIYPFRPSEAKSDGSFGSLAIARCLGCGHLYNAAFDLSSAEELYGAFVLTNTPVSEDMVRSVENTAEWIASGAQSNDTVLEVGGGAGALALAMARRGSDVHLVEPSHALTPDRFDGTGVTFYQSMFPAPVLGNRAFDIVICRQVLEHVPAPASFLSDLRARLNDGGIAYIEIPCAEYIVANRSIIDFHYPHVHYYGRTGVAALLARAGFEIVETCIVKDGHDVGFLLRGTAPTTPESPHDDSDGLPDALDRTRQKAAERLAAISGPIALYGANAYSQALFGLFPDFQRFVTMYDDTESYIGYSAYGAEVELPIGPPDRMQLRGIAAVIITAYLHDVTISRKLRTLGYEGQILTVRCDQTGDQHEMPQSLFR